MTVDAPVAGRVLIAASDYGGGIKRHLDLTSRAVNAPVVQLPKALSLPQKVARLRAELQRTDAQHLVTHGVAAALAGRLRGSSLNHVVHTEFWHGDPFFGARRRRLAYRLLRRVGRLPDHQVFVEESVAGLYGEAAVPRETLSNSVPIPEGSAERPAVSPRRAAFVGRLSPEKGYRELLAAWPADSRERGWVLDVYGAGPLESLPLPPGVTGHGKVSDGAALMSGVDLLVVPSWTEASPYAVLEALAQGVPFCGSAVGDMPVIAQGAGCAWLVEPRDVAALEQILRECQQRSAQELRAAGLAGQRWVSEQRPFAGWLSAVRRIYGAA